MSQGHIGKPLLHVSGRKHRGNRLNWITSISIYDTDPVYNNETLWAQEMYRATEPPLRSSSQQVH